MKRNNSNIEIKSITNQILSKHLKTTKRFREAWINRQSSFGENLFQYADNDFYFYRFAVNRQEQNTSEILTELLRRLLAEYGYSVLLPKEEKKAPFAFVIENRNNRKGYRFDDFYADEDINGIVDACQIDMAYIIRTWKHGDPDNWMARNNHRYSADQTKLQEISLEEFFDIYFCKQDYHSFLSVVQQYISDTREIIGFQSIKFLSAMNLSMQKMFAEKQLMDWPYETSHYQVIDLNNEKIRKYLYVGEYTFDPTLQQKIIENYTSHRLYRAFVGQEDFAKSFITSEWLYYSLKGAKNFDYTAVVSGYLKSIEQLLLKIVELNIDNDCVISMKNDKKLIAEAKANSVIFYNIDNNTHKKDKIERPIKFTYIDYTTSQKKYADSSIGTFEYFLRNNPNVFIDESLAQIIPDMVSCFRTECRNGYFHTHNLESWDVVEKTRENAILLYCLLLGSCTLASKKENELGIINGDSFDSLCKAIREFRHYGDFIFEYDDGTQKKVVFDYINNTMEFTDDGLEHYEYLLFYGVDDFSISSREKLNSGIKDEWKVYLTRESIPAKIWVVDRQRQLHEIYAQHRRS